MEVEIGRLQDEVIEILYELNSSFVLHGGTAIWRCYKGNRFSEDLDLYGNVNPTALAEKLKSRGLNIVKIKTTENLIFVKLSNPFAQIRVEINQHLKPTPVIMPYEKMNATFIDVYTLSVDDLIKEKISAYFSRRFIRDFYDIYHLVRVGGIKSTTKQALAQFLKDVPQPVDEKILKSLIYSGIPPTFNSMLSYLRRIV